jgi:hypothetical protein
MKEEKGKRRGRHKMKWGKRSGKVWKLGNIM